MPAKGSTGTTRRPPLRSDRGVRLYAPTMAKPYFRVVAAGQVERTSAPVPREHLAASERARFVGDTLDAATARARREADELFDQMVRWAKHQPGPVSRGDRTVNALCDRRLAELHDRRSARNTIDLNEGLMRLYVRPLIGRLEVADWSPEHSRAVLARARKTCGAERVADLGKVLRSLVTLAHRKPVWLARDEDPMEGVTFRVTATRQGEGVHYVPMKERPSSEQVDSLALAMQETGLTTQTRLARRPKKPVALDRSWGALVCQVMGRSGARFGEAICLTVTSVARPQITSRRVVSLGEEASTLGPVCHAGLNSGVVTVSRAWSSAMDSSER